MNITDYRQRIINIAKNLKNNGTAISHNTIIKIENIINFAFNLSNQHSYILKNKFELIIKKYALTIQNGNIQFTNYIDGTNMFVLYKQLSDFMYKIDFFVTTQYNQIENIQQLLNLINNNELDYITKIPITSNIANIDTFNDNEFVLSQLIKNCDQYGAISNIQSDNGTIDDIKANLYIGGKTGQIEESNAKNLID